MEHLGEQHELEFLDRLRRTLREWEETLQEVTPTSVEEHTETEATSHTEATGSSGTKDAT